MALEFRSAWRRAAIRIVDAARRTDALKLLPGLQESQWRSPAELAALQAERLAELGRFCLAEVSAYREPFHDLGIAAEGLTPETLARLPLMTKERARVLGNALRSRSFRRWQPRPKATSGSTGMPFNYYLDRPSHSYQWAHLWRGWSQVGYRPGDPYVTLSGGSLVPEKVDLKQRLYLALSGAVHLPSYHLDAGVLERYRRVLERRGAGFLYGYPSSVSMLAEHLLAAGGPRPPLRAVFTTSENLAPRARATIEEAFGCPCIDTYGCNDGGVYAFECERRDGFHVGQESVFVEIVDDDGRPLPEGEIGRIVTTNLAIRAMPLLRYVTGDLGALTTEPCACGRGLQRIVKLQGRERDVVVTPAGRRVHGAFFNHFAPFYRAEWLRRFQVYQPDRRALVLRLVVHREPTAVEREELLTELRRGLGEMDYRIEIVDRLEETRTGKFRVVVSDL